MKVPETIEIELKAHIEDPVECRKTLNAFAGSEAAFSKDDTYWFARSPNNESIALPPGGLRIRKETVLETGAFPKTRITWKNKEKREGIEINNEHELELKGDANIAELFVMLGLERRILKHKQGWFWHYNGITVELCEISGLIKNSPGKPDRDSESQNSKNLGWFLELEILASDDCAETIACAREKLLALLEKAGIGKESIENKYYSELLQEGQ